MENVKISLDAARQILDYVAEQIANYVAICCGGRIDTENIDGLVYICEAYRELEEAICKAENGKEG